ncbi:uncharacterized protein LOC130751686 isoform X1 [Actinidia eriantha]|uniref:uncharacterized protein LOC130751686 isoform X1 n=1 Tax=Actinidia eriantha TaxID=165200 RepID=UPI00258BC8A9|nr:uncharacterized protein LOC130751686 isoform X1 [Actinidia eriantha]
MPASHPIRSSPPNATDWRERGAEKTCWCRSYGRRLQGCSAADQWREWTKQGIDTSPEKKRSTVSVMKEKKWVVFKGEDDPTSIPVEWICWLNGQRKTAPTPEERMELEAKRERVRLNVALLKKEEEERRAKEGSSHTATKIGKVDVPDLRSFIRQFPDASKGRGDGETSGAMDGRSSEPIGSGESFRPGTWQPPT